MCTLTYIPLKNGDIAITHNRDEHRLRPAAIPPQAYPVGSGKAVFPKDPQSNGTWYAMHKDWVCCLLNGGFERHVSTPPYRRSRGTVIPDFLTTLDMGTFTAQFDAQGMEPFTFVAFDLKKQVVHQLVWDEKALHWQKLNPLSAHIWCSVTLYDSLIYKKRRSLFERFIDTQPGADAVFNFHQLYAGEKHDVGFFVNIDNQIYTVAIIQSINAVRGGMSWRYESFEPVVKHAVQSIS
jgi:uncharacterized protein with NRDE domain